jgi:hypothetical protein
MLNPNAWQCILPISIYLLEKVGRKKTEKVNYNQNNVKPGFLKAQNYINAIGKSSKKLNYT